MAIFRRASSQALVLASALLAGCSIQGTDGAFTTGSLTSQASSKADPACIALAAQIEELRKAGIVDKIEKAAARRYRLTKSDLRKADKLNKVNAEFQTRCSTVPGVTTAAAEQTTKGAKGAKKKAAKGGTKAAKTAKARAKTN